MAVQITPDLSTIERVFDEVDEYYGHIHRIRQKLSRLRRGSEAYLGLLPDLWVRADVLKRKAEFAAQLLEAFEDSLPDDNSRPSVKRGRSRS